MAPTHYSLPRYEMCVDLDKQEALRILEEIKENINVCCAITMEPDEVLVLVDKLKSYINGEQT